MGLLDETAPYVNLGAAKSAPKHLTRPTWRRTLPLANTRSTRAVGHDTPETRSVHETDTSGLIELTAFHDDTRPPAAIHLAGDIW